MPALLVCDPRDEATHRGLAPALLTLGADGGGTLMTAATPNTAAPVTPREPEDLAAILYTSGTTGRSKIGRAHVCTPVSNAHLVCRLLLETTNKHTINNTN